MLITVFGTGSLDERGYKEAYDLGKKIALAGHTLINGGYGGTMEASAKGCVENGGKAIGVCVEGHSFATAGKPNDFVSEVILTKNLNERITKLLKTDYIIVLPGKLGTLEELFRAWNEAYIDRKGMIYVVGGKNKGLIDFLIESDFISEERYFNHITCVESIDELNFLA